MTPAPLLFHQLIVVRLTTALSNFVVPNRLGHVFAAPCDVRLSDFDVVQPDVLFVSAERKAILTRELVDAGPDLCVEVLSPSSVKRDTALKSALYAKHRVREFWLADPDAKTITVLVRRGEGWSEYRAFGAEDTLDSPLLPGLSILLGPVFEEI